MHQIQTDHYPELAENGGAYLLAEEIGLGQVELLSATERRQALSQTSPEELADSVVRLNAVILGRSADEGKIEDGQLGDLPTPTLADKRPLLEEATAAFGRILQDQSLDDQTALRRAGLTLAGAINYIHPFEGNGRTARLSHYLVEFGAERGEQLFEAETFSAIGKVAVIEQDYRQSVDNTPVFEMVHTLNTYCENTFPSEWAVADGQTKASIRVRAFLAAMTGEAEVLTPEDIRITRIEEGELASYGQSIVEDGVRKMVGRTYGRETLPAGSNIRDVYEREYLANSFAAHVDPILVPQPMQRVSVTRQESMFDGIAQSTDVIS